MRAMPRLESRPAPVAPPAAFHPTGDGTGPAARFRTRLTPPSIHPTPRPSP